MNNRLASFRRAQGISLEEMAERLHIPPGDVLAIEEGRIPLQACSPEQLSEEEQQLLKRLRALDHVDRAAALRKAEGLAHGKDCASGS